MARFADIFATCRAERRGALMPYLTAGDPSLAATGEILAAVDAAGADIVELGIPFSDPLLDGPVIQESAQRAIAAGAKPARVIERIGEVRGAVAAGLLFMTPLNLVLRHGLRRFAADTAAAGVDGVLITDLPPEEAGEWCAAAADAGVATIGLLAPTSSPARIRATAAMTTGFIYCISRRGVTGVQQQVPLELGEVIGRIRAECDLPVAVGFGIATAEQVRQVCALADGAVVGSALVAELAAHPGAEAEAAARFVAELRAGVKVSSR